VVITTDGQVPEEHVVTVVVVAGPANLNLVIEPSVGTVMVIVQEGRAAKLCWPPSNAIDVGLTAHPLTVPVFVGTPLATDIVIFSVTEAMTVSWVDPVLPRASTAITVWAPIVEVGTAKVALKVPVEEDVTVVGEVVWATPSYLIVIVEEAAKPVPETVTVPPTMVLVGLRVTDALTVYVAEPVWADTSVAVTVWAPFVEMGTENVALKEPMVDEATVVGDVVCVVPSYFMVMVEDGANPVPDTVTVVATVPPVGPRVIAAVTENVAVAVWDDMSVAVTVCAPFVEAGTLKDAVNTPELSVLTLPTVEESYVMVTVEVGVKLVPDTVTSVPTVPDVGLRVIPGIRVNVADAELENPSVAVTVCPPRVDAGTVKVAVNAPVFPLLAPPMVSESKVTVIAEDPENPDPVTVNEEPTLPLVGLSVIEAATVNAAVAVCEAASAAVTEWVPLVEAGTVNVALKDPTEFVVTVVGAVACATPSYLMVIVEEAANPVPVTVTVVPTLPLAGLRVMKATMLKVAVATCVDASVTVTVWAPFVEVPGTVKVALKDPMLLLVIVEGDVGWVAPSYLMVMVEEAAKPAPDTVTVVPPIPFAGLRVIDGLTV
jgi:hypothetical protein